MLIVSVEKLLTSLALPSGLLWLSLAVLALVLYWRNRRAMAAFAFILWLFLSVAANVYVSWALAAWTERGYRDIDPMAIAESFDAVVVLGGGERETPMQAPQLAESGDRVMLGARLYLTGKTQLLVTAGGEDYEHAEIAYALWRDLQVPAEDILKISGRNTAAEMRSLAELMEEKQWEKVGLVTSAFHMARAMRLAEGQGLELQPLPADFKSKLPDFCLSHFVPAARALERTEIMTKEMLARLVGR